MCKSNLNYLHCYQPTDISAETFFKTDKTESYAKQLRQSPFFTNLPPTLLNEMAQSFRLEEWPQDYYIDPETLRYRFHILLEGSIEKKRYNPDNGRQVTLDVFYPGDSFDVIPLLDGKPHDVIMEPLSALKLISVPMKTMQGWIKRYPELNARLLPFLAKQIREQEDLSTNLVLHDVATRLRQMILKHLYKSKHCPAYHDSDHDDKQGENYPKLIDMPDERLASMIGSVRQVVNKQIGKLKKRGILDKKQNKLIILNQQQLAEKLPRLLS